MLVAVTLALLANGGGGEGPPLALASDLVVVVGGGGDGHEVEEQRSTYRTRNTPRHTTRTHPHTCVASTSNTAHAQGQHLARTVTVMHQRMHDVRKQMCALRCHVPWS